MTRTHDIQLTALDTVRLERALVDLLQRDAAEPQGAADLEALLDTAAIVPSDSIDADIVTMNSTVILQAQPSGERQLVVAALTCQPEANGRFDL
jgi:transcription elongation GreA/GreB family factor